MSGEGNEAQQEELEVLRSIYDGDEGFKEISANSFQYKYGAEGDPKSFVLEISWGAEYPDVIPQVSMGAFYNRSISDSVKKYIVDKVVSECDQYLGCAMTYSLFEWLKESCEQIISDAIASDDATPEPNINSLRIAAEENESSSDDESKDGANVAKSAKVKKEQLTKAQKRRQWDKMDGKGDKPRGWDWVDIVKHLSQTGVKQNAPASSQQQNLPN